MKHEREEMDSVVMLHRVEMDIKLREERAMTILPFDE